MYSTESIRQRIELCWTPVLTGYSREDSPSKTTQSHLLLRQDEIRPNKRPGIQSELRFSRRPVCEKVSNALGCIKCYSLSSADLLKALVILSDTPVRR